MKLCEAVKAIKSTNGNNAKMALLEEYAENIPHFKDLLYYVYSKKYKYYLRAFQVEESGGHDLDEVFEQYVDLLMVLCTRKVTGNAAKEHVDDFAKTLTEDGKALLGLTLSRSLDFGLNEKSINKVCPSLLPSNSYMRCSTYNGNAIQKWLTAGDVVLAQEKMDGMFVVLDPSTRTIRTRSGKYFELADDVFLGVWDDIKTHGDFVLHGEIVTFNDEGKQNAREISNGLLNSTLKMGTDPGDYRIFLWDCVDITTEDGNADNTPYKERFQKLLSVIGNGQGKRLLPVENIIASSIEDIQEFYSKILRNGGEGLVIKNGNAPWENKTSKFQLKLKNEVDVDLRIVGYNPGRGKFEGMIGSVICESCDGLLTVDVSGMNDATRKFITDNHKNLIGGIITVKANCLMEKDGGYTLFLPRFVELREDKTKADDIERIKEMFNTFF